MKAPLLLTAAAAVITALVISCGDAEEEIAPTPTAASATPDATQAPTATTSPAASPSPSVAPGSTLTYTDPAYGYSLEYPATWHLTTPKETGGDLVLQSYDPATAPGIGGPLPKDKLKVLFWVAEGVTKSLPDWLAEGDTSTGQILPPVIVSQEETTLADKQGVKRVTDEGEGITHVNYYLSMGGGRVFVINAGRGDSELWPDLELILASIRFAP
jgi:hypothetical protein